MNAKKINAYTAQATQIDDQDSQTAPLTNISADEPRSSVWPIVWIGALTVGLRMLTLCKPLTGYFSLKSCVSAMVARNWAMGRTSLWHPMLDCIRGGERSLHMVEVPCSAYLAGLAWRWFGGSLDVWGRLFSIVWMLGAVVMLYFYVRRHHGRTAAAGAAFALAVSPVSVIFGQHFMLEPSMVFLTIATIFALDTGLRSGRWRWTILSALALALLLLTKIYMLVLLLPIGLMILSAFFKAKKTFSNHNHPPQAGIETSASILGKKTAKLRLTLSVLLFSLALIPAIVWYAHAYQVGSEGHPLANQVYYSVAQSTESHHLPHPLWTSPKFYLHTFDSFATLVLTPIGVLLFWFGLLDRGVRRHLAWLAASLLLIWLLPRKFYEMSYYYVVLLPPICILVGLGWSRLATGMRLSRWTIFLTALLAVVVSMRYVAGPLFVLDEEDRPVVTAAEAVKRLTRPEDRVIAIHATGIDLLYYCDRPGWTGQMRPDDWAAWVESCRAEGAKYLVLVETTSMPTPPVAEFSAVPTPPN